jgi:hypothetical protein
MIFKPRRQMDYIWLQVTERENGKEYSRLSGDSPFANQEHPARIPLRCWPLQKMRTVLRGMSGARVNLAYLVAGIFRKDPPLGIVQCYGTVTFDTDLETGRTEVQARYRRPGGRAERPIPPTAPGAAKRSAWPPWIYAPWKFPVRAVAVGHPDPRENARTHNNEMQNPQIGTAIPGLFHPTKRNPVPRHGLSPGAVHVYGAGLQRAIEVIANMLAGYAQEASIWASQQTGVRSASFGISLPAILTGAMADTARAAMASQPAGGYRRPGPTPKALPTPKARPRPLGAPQRLAQPIRSHVGETTGTSTTNTEGTTQTTGVAHGTSSSSTSGSSSTTSGGSASMTGPSPALRWHCPGRRWHHRQSWMVAGWSDHHVGLV